MMDSLSLGRSLAKYREKSIPEMLKEYETEMIPRATKAVLDSRNADGSGYPI